MNCPSCNHTAASFIRYAVSLKGVSVTKSMQGYLKCQNCGTLLRVTSFGKQFWVFFIATLVILAVFVVLYPRLFSIVGTGATAAIGIILVLMIVTVFTFALWRFARVQKVDSDNRATTTSA
jgi:hypothetical protein